MLTLADGAFALLHVELTPGQLAAFQSYADELRAWNDQFNLTAIRDLEGIQVKHFLDSLSLLRALRPAAADKAGETGAWPAELSPRLRLIDVGTGAGFPGLPLKIVCPQLQVTLLEATGKKVKFCEHIADKLKLTGLNVVKGRAEEVGQDSAHREQYDWVVARAVAEMPTLVEYMLPLARRGGHAVAQKGDNAPAETHSAEAAVKHLGGELERLIPVEVPGIVETRYLVVFRKVAATPPLYPRRTGVPTKSPLT
jgi:16S rRNA (guanine527-N7)-methyltransferase